MLRENVPGAARAVLALILLCCIVSILANHNLLVVLAHLPFIHTTLSGNGSVSSFCTDCLVLGFECLLQILGTHDERLNR